MKTKKDYIDKMKMEIAKEHGVEHFEDIDRGNLSSRVNGDMIGNLTKIAKETTPDGIVPGTIKKQNLGHNSKKEGLGPNTRR